MDISVSKYFKLRLYPFEGPLGDAQLVFKTSNKMVRSLASSDPSHEVAFMLAIDKWRSIEKILSGEITLPPGYENCRFNVYDGSRRTCALCRLYWPQCYSCPVKIFTQRDHCARTPYTAYQNARVAAFRLRSDADQEELDKHLRRCYFAARAERRFLQFLQLFNQYVARIGGNPTMVDKRRLGWKLGALRKRLQSDSSS